MDIITQVEYSTNVTITDPITGETAIASLKAVKYSDNTVQGFVCGIAYETVSATLNPQVEIAYQNFMAQVLATL